MQKMMNEKLGIADGRIEWHYESEPKQTEE